MFPEGVRDVYTGGRGQGKRKKGWFDCSGSACSEVYYQTDKHLTALTTAVLTVNRSVFHCEALTPLTLSVSFWQRPICLVPWIQSNKYGNKQRARGTALQFAGCLSTLSSIKMRDKSKACLILACGGRAQTQTICLCVITQCTVRGKGERYNRCRGEAHAAYYGCWETQKRDYACPRIG